jgi:hypothetical protein
MWYGLPMRRAQLILVIVGLLSTPLALLARGISCDNSTFVCCMMHSQHSQICHCPVKTGHRALDFGFIAPMAPTQAMPTAELGVPVSLRRAVTNYEQSPLSRLPSEPFEPPRT